MAPDPEGFLKDLMPTRDDWRLLVGGVGSANAGWLTGMVNKYLKWEDADVAGALAGYVGYKLSPRLKGNLGEAAKSFFLGTLFSNIGLAAKKRFPQVEFKITEAAGMPEQPSPPPPAAPPAPQTIEELAALEAQISTAKYFGK